jgi:membrane-bound serine protease (ClpP class)
MKRHWVVFAFALALELLPAVFAVEKTVYVLPIREEIATPLTFLVRRGVKQAIAAKADLLVLDMDTNGGRLDSTEDILHSLQQFHGATVTFVDREAFSAGAFIAVATQKIFMAPQGVIGAAAPILMNPGGGVEKLPDTVEAKMTSGVRALVRTSAQKNGYNTEVIEAMIDHNREVKIDGTTINPKGEILTLTNVEAEKQFGSPPRPLLSSGTVDSLDGLFARLGFTDAKIVRIEPTGAEHIASWLTSLGPLLLLIGIVGTFIEIKTPGFGLPGIVGGVAFALYFLGGYVAGLSGMEWALLFAVGLVFFILELFVFTGTLALGFIGAALMLAALVMAMVDVYPGMPAIPRFDVLRDSLMNVLITIVASIVVIMFLSRYVLKTPLFHRMVPQSASGVLSTARTQELQSGLIGVVGVAASTLRPGGKAQFGSTVLDVITQGEMIQRGASVKIIGFSGRDAVVEAAEKSNEKVAAV